MNWSGSLARSQEVDELRRFAGVPPSLPDYDLPMLKTATAGGGVASTSSERTNLVDVAVSDPVSNQTAVRIHHASFHLSSRVAR